MEGLSILELAVSALVILLGLAILWDITVGGSRDVADQNRDRERGDTHDDN